MLCVLCIEIESLLREFNHDEMLHIEFGQNTCLISEISAYFRAPKITFQTENHDYERLCYLDNYPLIKEVYLKYNCISPTEADVERVFSYAGISLSYLFNCAVH